MFKSYIAIRKYNDTYIVYNILRDIVIRNIVIKQRVALVYWGEGSGLYGGGLYGGGLDGGGLDGGVFFKIQTLRRNFKV